jgi:hypothetical protein
LLVIPASVRNPASLILILLLARPFAFPRVSARVRRAGHFFFNSFEAVTNKDAAPDAALAR